MFTQIEEALISLAGTLPLELFVFIASIVEEIVAPIPSPTIMMVAGSIALLQERTMVALLPLVVLGAFGKTIGATVVYFIADRAEGFVMGRFGRFFGITPEEIQQFSERIGTGPRGYVILTIMRALPFIPSTLISVGSGLIKVRLPIFIFATFIGSLFRDGFYIYTGYLGAKTLTSLVTNSSRLENYIEAIFVVLALGYLGYKIYRRKKIPTTRV